MVSIGRGLLVFCFILGASAHAQYFCSADAKRDGLLYKDQTNKTWEISNIQFDKTPFLDSYLSCMQLLEKIPKGWGTHADLIPLYPYSKNMVRFHQKDPLLQLCLDTPSCHLSFFENFFYPRLLVNSLMKPKTFASNSVCMNHELGKFQQITQSLLPISTQLSLDKVWHIPEVKLDEVLFKKLDQEKPKKIYLSSMIFSRAILNQLDDWLIKNPTSEAWAFFAYNLHVLENGFPNSYQPRSSKFHLLPVFQTPFAPDSYHVKGVVLEGKKLTTLLMTVNIRRFREEKVADRIFELNGSEAFNSYLSILSQVMDEQCSQTVLLSCSNILRYPEGDLRSQRVSEWVQDSCKHRIVSPLKKEQQTLFSRARFTPLESQVEDAIKNAKKSVFISSHVFHESKISLALLDAALRGVDVKLLVGTQIEDPFFLARIQNPLHLKLLTRETGLTAHAKFMIVDDELAIWGTGNFTKTSLQNPWEIFLATKDPKFLSELRAYIKDYY